MDLKKAVQVLWRCVAVTLMLLVLFLRLENNVLLFLLLGAGGVTAVIWVVFIRCPHCGAHLGREVGKHCPHCGKETGL